VDPVEPIETPFELPVQSSSEPIIPGHSGSPTPWPDDAIGAHGWLALGSGTPDAAPPWGTIQASESALILDPAFSVPPGSSLQALVIGGRVPVTTTAQETATYGCEGGHPVEGVTPLQGEVGPGMVWVVSPTFGNAQGLEVKTVDEEGRRTWSFGDHTLGLVQTDTWHANLWLDQPERSLKQYAQAEQFIDDENEPIDIRDGFRVPQVSAAWQVGSKTVVGLYWFSFEGVHFDALLISGEDASLHELGYLYRCAN
jgi:hypothetical protein